MEFNIKYSIYLSVQYKISHIMRQIPANLSLLEYGPLFDWSVEEESCKWMQLCLLE